VTFSAAAGGVGVVATGTTGAAALKVTGLAEFSRSGTLTIASGATSATKTGVGLSKSSLVLATIQGAPGNSLSSVQTNVTGKSFTINLTQAASTTITVAWFILN
jgi:hypothetical protein